MQETGMGDAGTAQFVAVAMPLVPEDQARADMYGLLARLLLAPPDAALLVSLAGADHLLAADGAQPLEHAWAQLCLVAGLLPLDLVVDEFNDLFISTAAPKISPHGSIYLAGFLHEKPLVLLRADLARLGLGRRPGISETEDHLGVLCETMRQLIVRRCPIDSQQAFFDSHLASWAPRCLEQLGRADGAQFYARVAALTTAFISIEQQAFQLAGDEA